MFERTKNDSELLRASLQGSPKAFGVLVSRYQSLVCTITYSATGSVEQSEEPAQEVFLRAWRSLGQLQDLSKFRAWLCSIARSTVRNWFRAPARRGGAGGFPGRRRRQARGGIRT
jgi:RNA polymerase sigma factor (sigma-70 family)